VRGTNTTVEVDPRKCLLVSYHYFKAMDLTKEIPALFGTPIPKVFLDSGAWSAFNVGSEISLDEYIAFVHRNREVLWCYSNLDVMTSDARTLANQTAMEAEGLEPVPVFHTGDDWRFLEAYVEAYPFIALGKIIPYTGSPKKIIPWLAKCFRVAQGKSIYHGFGCSNVSLLKLFPFFSSDSSAWGGSYRYGRVPLWDEAAATMRSVEYAEAHKNYSRDKALWDEHEHAMLQPLAEDVIPYKKIGVVSAIAYMKMADWLSRARGSRYNFFFAAVPGDWTRVADGFRARYAPLGQT
jgi:hypothetical protein